MKSIITKLTDELVEQAAIYEKYGFIERCNIVFTLHQLGNIYLVKTFGRHNFMNMVYAGALSHYRKPYFELLYKTVYPSTLDKYPEALAVIELILEMASERGAGYDEEDANKGHTYYNSILNYLFL